MAKKKPAKQRIFVYIEKLNLDYLNLDDAINRLAALKTAYEEGYSNLQITPKSDSYSDQDQLWLEGRRPENDFEYQERVNKEQIILDNQRHQYEELKKKFDP